MYRLILIFLLLVVACKKETNLEGVSLELDPQISLHDVYFVHDSLAYIVGGQKYHTYTILRSTDAGHSWQELRPSELNNAKFLYHIDLTHGILHISGEDGIILTSTDSGSTWVEYQDYRWAEVFGIAYISDSVGIAASTKENSSILSQINHYGQSLSDATFSTSLNCVHVNNSEDIVVGGAGMILYSHDGGKEFLASDAEGDVFIDMTEVGSDLIAIGYYGKVYKSSDRGESWSKINRIKSGGSYAALRKIIILQDGRQLIVGDKGLVFVSSDQWNSYNSYKVSQDNFNILAVAQAPDGSLILAGTGGLLLREVKL